MNESVKIFYDQNPYPSMHPFIKILPKSGIIEEGCIKAGYKTPQKPKILIIGCGTIATKALSLAYPDAESIYAIDISEKVLKIAQKSIDKKNNSHIHFIEGDIEDPNILKLLPEDYFDFIHCTGVLHHLENPENGIANISKLLNKTGIIRFQVYSKGARTLIEWARQCFIKNKATSTQDVRQILIALSKYHPFRYALATYPESVTESGLLDGFLHPLVKMFYTQEWERYFNNSNLKILSLENLHYLENANQMFSKENLDNFNKKTIAEKVTIFEKLGEWRSDLKGYLVKSDLLDCEDSNNKNIGNVIIDNIDSHSFPRLYIWHEIKSALKAINFNPEKADFEKLLANLSNKEWLPGITGIYYRLYWVAHRSECKQLATPKYILELNKENLIDDYINNDEEIFIPSPENWPFEQWENGFFAWKWDYLN